MKYLMLFVIMILQGCASLAPKDHEYTWYKSDRPELPYRVEVVEEWPEDVRKYCGKHFVLHACAVFYWEIETKIYTKCVIYTKYKNMPQFLLEHEIKHCKGWNHN